MKEYHYVYKITNLNPTDERKFYIGVRTSTVLPEEDIKYMGSSKYLTKYIEELGIQNFSKSILSTWETRQEANQEEIRLHTLHEVSINRNYYNKAEAKNAGFCTYNKIVVKNLKTDTIELIEKQDYCANNFSHFHSGKRLVKNLITDKYLKITNIEYNNNKDLYNIAGTKLIHIYDYNGNLRYTSNTNFQKLCKDNDLPHGALVLSYQNGGEPLYCNPQNTTGKILEKNKKFFGWYAISINDENYRHNHEMHLKYKFDNKMILVLHENNVKEISFSDYLQRKSEFEIITKTCKVIRVYDCKDVLMFTSVRDFRKMCEVNELPFRALSNSYRNNGLPLYIDYSIREMTKLNKNGNIRYCGWYAKMEEL